MSDLKGLHRHTREIIEWAVEALREFSPQSLRHLYYAQSATLGYTYDQLKNPLKVARLRGIIEYDDIVDTTRDPIGPHMYGGLTEFTPMAPKLYRHDIWSNQPAYIEVWCEAESTVPIVDEYTWDLGVKLQACRGDMGLYPTYQAAERFKLHLGEGRCVVLIHVGDWNPKGEQIPKTIQASLLERHEVAVEFMRVAITPEQIDAYHLPSRDVNMQDPQAVPWVETHGDDAKHVELEALPPDALVSIIRGAVEAELDLDAMGRKLKSERRIRREIERRLRRTA